MNNKEYVCNYGRFNQTERRKYFLIETMVGLRKTIYGYTISGRKHCDVKQ